MPIKNSNPTIRSQKKPPAPRLPSERVIEFTAQLFQEDLHAKRVQELLGEAGVVVDYRSFDRMGHSMHGQDPQLFTETLIDWSSAQTV